MLIGVPREIKAQENRVGLTPESVHELTKRGHEVVVETTAGQGIGAGDDAYRSVGATIALDAAEVFEKAEMVVKVKEPQAIERAMLRPGQILYTYLHLAPDAEQTKDLVKSGAICIAYETVTDNQGGLPLLKPMSQVAGRLSVQSAAKSLELINGGRGVLMGGVPGVSPAKVTVIGGGVVGFNAAQMAVGMQADVTILDTNPNTLERLSNYFGSSARVLHSNSATLEREVVLADVVIGAVLIPGAAAPKLVKRDMLASMYDGAVMVDVAIDQGGCFETSEATTHAEPTYVVDGVVHYCVANMPGAVARTSTYALNNATLQGAIALADKGWKNALRDDQHLRNGLNVANGQITYEAVARDLGYEYISANDLMDDSNLALVS